MEKLYAEIIDWIVTVRGPSGRMAILCEYSISKDGFSIEFIAMSLRAKIVAKSLSDIQVTGKFIGQDISEHFTSPADMYRYFFYEYEMHAPYAPEYQGAEWEPCPACGNTTGGHAYNCPTLDY